MPSRRDDAEQVHPETLADWRAWLDANHARPDGVWLVSWKPATGRPFVPYEQVVEEALCYGWIDSSGRTLDEERSALWMAPRKRGSGWARSNKERIVRLEAEGRMTDAGRALIEAAKADGSWTLLDSVEAGEVPDDLRPGVRGVPRITSDVGRLPEVGAADAPRVARPGQDGRDARQAAHGDRGEGRPRRAGERMGPEERATACSAVLSDRHRRRTGRSEQSDGRRAVGGIRRAARARGPYAPTRPPSRAATPVRGPGTWTRGSRATPRRPGAGPPARRRACHPA